MTRLQLSICLKMSDAPKSQVSRGTWVKIIGFLWVSGSSKHTSKRETETARLLAAINKIFINMANLWLVARVFSYTVSIACIYIYTIIIYMYTLYVLYIIYIQYIILYIFIYSCIVPSYSKRLKHQTTHPVGVPELYSDFLLLLWETFSYKLMQESAFFRFKNLSENWSFKIIHSSTLTFRMFYITPHCRTACTAVHQQPVV